jgi:mono/diheme cytochrome c family protein
MLLFVSICYGQQGNRDDAAVATKLAKEKASGDSELDKAPSKARARRNPLEHDPDAVATGKKLFFMHCAECHGEAAEGTRHAPNLHDAEVQEAAPGAIFWVLTNGIVWHGMPVWSKLPEAQRWQLVAYIKSLGGTPKGPRSLEHSADIPSVCVAQTVLFTLNLERLYVAASGRGFNVRPRFRGR